MSESIVPVCATGIFSGLSIEFVHGEETSYPIEDVLDRRERYGGRGIGRRHKGATERGRYRTVVERYDDTCN